MDHLQTPRNWKTSKSTFTVNTTLQTDDVIVTSFKMLFSPVNCIRSQLYCNPVLEPGEKKWCRLLQDNRSLPAAAENTAHFGWMIYCFIVFLYILLCTCIFEFYLWFYNVLLGCLIGVINDGWRIFLQENMSAHRTRASIDLLDRHRNSSQYNWTGLQIRRISTCFITADG